MEILIYLLKASAISALFLLVYYLFLRRDTYHQFKRIYLMFGMVISAILPWLYYTKMVIVETSSNNFSTPILNAEISNTENSNAVSAVRDVLTFSWDEILLILYLLVSLILMARLVFNYAKLFFQLHNTTFKTIDNFKVHIVKESFNPFSFFNHIVIGQKDYESKNFDMIFAHEKAHIMQWHSVDILISNLFCVAFWFNPLMWFYKTSIVQNLEHIADKQSIEMINDKLNYQYLLLSNSFSTSDLQTIQTTFFQSSIKQRIMMLNKSTTSKIYALKSIIILPILVLFFMNFQAKVVAQEKENSWKVNAKLKSVQFSDSTGTITTNYNGNNSQTPNLKNDTIDFIKNSKVSDDSLNKNERIAIKITKDANKEFLDWTKKYLKKEYNIDVNYSKIKFNKNNELISIKAEVNSNDGFKGSSNQKGAQPIYDFYIYRDYSENTKSPFGLTRELPSNSSEKEEDKITHTTSVIISPRGFSKKEVKPDVDVKLKSDSENFKSIEKLIINGENFDIKDLASNAIFIKSYNFIDGKTIEIKGQIVENKDYESYLKSKIKSTDDNTLRDFQVLMITKKAEPIFMNIDKLTVEDGQ